MADHEPRSETHVHKPVDGSAGEGVMAIARVSVMIIFRSWLDLGLGLTLGLGLRLDADFEFRWDQA